MTLFTKVILLVFMELITTQGPRSGLIRNNIEDTETSKKHFNHCINCIGDKPLLLINTQLKEYHNSSCNIFQSNLSEWCIQRLKVIINKKVSVCKIYPIQCECLKSCYQFK
ncbi:uncharacterized protein LOC101239748 [Hydra vulgaris]|uniref:uncharacterized protein LOC101239748 n=1 Tax=Hydra vulgaris TaxID=6087 RepID=UPI000640D3C9|nr:uncharacterized protein LOC101239748 [Hydra vulgaris]